MSADSGDSLRIPIEIKTDDLDEIRKLINEIKQADDDLQHLKAVPKKGRGTGDTSSRSAFAPSQAEEGRGGIFGGQQSTAVPGQKRDTSSQTPVQRENEFAKLQTQVQEQQQRSGLFGEIQSGLGGAGQAAVNLATSAPDGKGFLLGSLGGLASKAFLPLAVITTIVGIVKGIIDNMLAPGGILDRRFKRLVETEVASASSLEKKAKINQGFLVIRTQVYPGIRGEAGTNSSLRSPQIFNLGQSNSMLGIGP